MDDADGVRDRVRDLLARYRIPSAAVGVLRDGRTTEFAVGLRDVPTRSPATAGTVYQIGSMTKTWTALAFLQLVDEGRAALDAPVRTWLPDFRVADADVSAAVTPRHLLNHTHGIEEDFGDPGEGDDVYARMVANAAGAGQVHPLGATHGYSAALGYAVLARIIEVVRGGRWDEVVDERLFGPLGLTATTGRPERVDRARAATGHVLRSLDEGPIPSPVPHLPRAFGPSGTVSSTVGDVLALARLVLDEGRAPDGRRILSAELVREMQSSRVPVPDPYLFGPCWALGLIVCDWHGRTVHATDGSTIGQNARLRILPDAGTAIAVLTNGGPREAFTREVLDAVLDALGEGSVPGLPAPDPALVLDPARYEGAYARPGARFEVRAQGGGLTLTRFVDPRQAAFLGRPARVTRPLLPVSPTHFLVPSDDPLEDTATLAIHEVGPVRHLHTDARTHPRVGPLSPVDPAPR